MKANRFPLVVSGLIVALTAYSANTAIPHIAGNKAAVDACLQEDDVCKLAGQGPIGACCPGLVCQPVGQYGSMCSKPGAAPLVKRALLRQPASRGIGLLAPTIDRFFENQDPPPIAPMIAIEARSKPNGQGFLMYAVNKDPKDTYSAVVGMKSIAGDRRWDEVTLSPGGELFLGEDRPNTGPSQGPIVKPWYQWASVGNNKGLKPAFPKPTRPSPEGAVAIQEQWINGRPAYLYLWNRDGFSNVHVTMRTSMVSPVYKVCIQPGSVEVVADVPQGTSVTPWVDVQLVSWWGPC